MAQKERDKIKQRQAEGIQALKNRNGGKGKGRPKIDFPLQWKTFYTKWKEKSITAKECMEHLKLKRNTFYNLVKIYEKCYKN
jgi:DNA invertase Pin-like site-specific DNA recombinase